jgi:hypothetical protein
MNIVNGSVDHSDQLEVQPERASTTASARADEISERRRLGKRKALLLIGPCVLLALLHVGLALTRDRPLVFADEAGYLGNARFLAGGLPIKLYRSAAYSPGYSLLLVPFYWLGLSPARTYQAILILNGLLASTQYISLVYWMRRVLGERSPYAYAIAFVTSLYPAFLVQPLLAMSESAVVPLSAVLPLVAYATVEKKRASMAALFGALVAYLYVVHPRYICSLALAAFGVTALAVARVLPRRSALAALLTLGSGALAGRALMNYVTAANHGGAVSAGSRLHSLTTSSGLAKLALEMAGQYWYLVAATAGLAVVGLLALGALALRSPEGGRRLESPGWNAIVFTLLGAGLAFNVSSLFMSTGDRVDHFIYGRYNEGTLAPFIATGLWAMFRRETTWRATARTLGVVLASALLLPPLLIWARGDAWLGHTNVGNILGIILQWEWFSETRLLGIGAVAAGAYLLLVFAVRWRPVWSIVLLAGMFLPVAFEGHRRFLKTQQGRAARQVLFDRVAALPDISKISYDASYSDPPTLFFGQYILPKTEFVFFESARGEQPPSDIVLGHESWPGADELPAELLGRDRLGYSLWRLQKGCTTSGDVAAGFGAATPPGVTATGFYPAESWPIGAVRWTNGQASIQIPVLKPAFAARNLYVDIASVGPSRNRVVISANGRELFSGKLGKGRSRLLLSLENVPAESPLDVQIQSRTFVPAESSTSADARTLGVALHDLRVLDERCLSDASLFGSDQARVVDGPRPTVNE